MAKVGEYFEFCGLERRIALTIAALGISRGPGKAELLGGLFLLAGEKALEIRMPFFLVRCGGPS